MNMKLAERMNNIGIELAPTASHQLVDRLFLADRFAIGPFLGWVFTSSHRVERIDDGDNLALDRNIYVMQTFRITTAVWPFVVILDPWHHFSKRPYWCQYLRAKSRMFSYVVHFLLSQFCRLIENRFVYSDLSYVM